MNILSLYPPGVVFVNESTNDTIAGVPLSMATPMRNYSSVVELRLITYDLNAIKANTELATEVNTRSFTSCRKQ